MSVCEWGCRIKGKKELENFFIVLLISSLSSVQVWTLSLRIGEFFKVIFRVGKYLWSDKVVVYNK